MISSKIVRINELCPSNPWYCELQIREEMKEIFRLLENSISSETSVQFLLQKLHLCGVYNICYLRHFIFLGFFEAANYDISSSNSPSSSCYFYFFLLSIKLTNSFKFFSSLISDFINLQSNVLPSNQLNLGWSSLNIHLLNKFKSIVNIYSIYWSYVVV